MTNNYLTYSASKSKPKPATLKRELLAIGVIEECALCHLKSTWNGKPLDLKLDHIDQNLNNNYPSNLRLVCPNCQSQLPKRKRLKKACSWQEQMCRETDKEFFKDIAVAIENTAVSTI